VTLRAQLFATGIRRLGGPRNGFRCRRADGRGISRVAAARIEALRIPSAWLEVRIASSPAERLQAIGRDAAGRWQYLYRRSYTARRARAHFDRLIDFASALPRLRRAIARDLARPGLPREKALAGAVALLAACCLRPGAQKYARDNGSFGLATLQDRHVAITGDRIRLDFRGKHGKRQQYELRDATLARLVARMKRLPGEEVFKFVDTGDRVRDLRGEYLNVYIQDKMGARFSARMFRTWGGTLMCAQALADALALSPAIRARTPRGDSQRRAALASALRDTAARLGNTLAVCRRAYIHPDLLRAFAAARMQRRAWPQGEPVGTQRRAALDRAERALLALLRSQRRSRGQRGQRL